MKPLIIVHTSPAPSPEQQPEAVLRHYRVFAADDGHHLCWLERGDREGSRFDRHRDLGSGHDDGHHPERAPVSVGRASGRDWSGRGYLDQLVDELWDLRVYRRDGGIFAGGAPGIELILDLNYPLTGVSRTMREQRARLEAF